MCLEPTKNKQKIEIKDLTFAEARNKFRNRLKDYAKIYKSDKERTKVVNIKKVVDKVIEAFLIGKSMSFFLKDISKYNEKIPLNKCVMTSWGKTVINFEQFDFEPTVLNSNLFPVKAIGDVLLRSVLSNNISGILSDGKTFNTYSTNYPNLVEKLSEQNISIVARRNNKYTDHSDFKYYILQ